MNYRVINKDTYYRRGVYRHFTEDCKCSTSMTARLDVTELAAYSKRTGTKFSLNFLYLLCRVLNSRDDYRMGYLWESDELICYDVIHPTQYVFHEDTETCTPVYTTYDEDYETFYKGALEDLERAKETREYGLDAAGHPNWFDASYIPWVSYDALNIELPDGYLYFLPIVNWGRYREENGQLMMPVTVRLNHAVADGYLVAKVFTMLEKEIREFCAPPVEVVAALIWKDGRFMICQRPANKARALLWEFVGGKVEAGESKKEALARECREELDIDIKAGSVFTEVVHEYPDITVHLTLFNTEIAAGEPRLIEHADLKWITPDEIPLYDFCPADTQILEKIQKSSSSK